MPTVDVSEARAVVSDFGTCLRFVSASNHIVSATSVASQNSLPLMSFSAWIYKITSGGGGFGFIFSKGGTNGQWIKLYQDNNTANCLTIEVPYSGGNNQFRTDANVIKRGKWMHIGFSMDFSSINNSPVFYVNGQLAATTRFNLTTGTKTADGTVIDIGNRSSDSARGFDGFIDDVQLYNRILTASEFADLNFRRSFPISDGLVGHWKFDEASGTTAIDSVGGANGTITGATYATNVVCKPRLTTAAI